MVIKVLLHGVVRVSVVPLQAWNDRKVVHLHTKWFGGGSSDLTVILIIRFD
jgi:hypothetical protein